MSELRKYTSKVEFLYLYPYKWILGTLFNLINSISTNDLILCIGWSKKKVYELIMEEKCYDKVFLSIYSHLLKKLDLSKLCRNKVMGL